jgi:hypothetical protein
MDPVAFVREVAVSDVFHSGRGWRCLSILGAVWSVLPPECAHCLGRSVVPFSERLDPSRL